jgi:membrane associated rhomboid family serine protease
MDDSDPREQIQTLENRIEELAEIIERCRKVIVISKAAIVLGGLLTLAIMFGAVGFDPVAMIAAITAVIGGAVLLGSNSSTLAEKTAALQAAEAERTTLISRIDLRLVADADGRSLPRPG